VWCQENLQVPVRSPRKRAGTCTTGQVAADAPKVVWALDFQFDSTIDEQTRESLLNLVERSITGEALVDELEAVFAAVGGPPMVLRMDNGPEMISQALQRFCAGQVGLSYIPPDNRGRTGTSNRSTTGYARSASTATTGRTSWKPGRSSATSSATREFPLLSPPVLRVGFFVPDSVDLAGYRGVGAPAGCSVLGRRAVAQRWQRRDHPHRSGFLLRAVTARRGLAWRLFLRHTCILVSKVRIPVSREVEGPSP
jgi:hypothetical protein